MWTPVDRGGGGQKPDFVVDVVNRWSLMSGDKTFNTKEHLN